MKENKHDKIYLEVGRKIATYRKQTGLTQEEFANKIGISYSYYTQIESPNVIIKMSIEVLLDICDALNINIKELF